MEGGKSIVMGSISARRSSVLEGNASAKGTRTGTGENEPRVKITVLKEGAPDVVYEVKRSSRLSRVMFDYCQVMEVNYKELKFTYLGKQVHDFDTPDTLEMGDDEVLDCWSEQLGG